MESTPTQAGREPGAVSLCLAGGGLSGAFFEFGAVAALSAGLPGWWPDRTRVVVGTSGGSVVGAVLALGRPPEDALRMEAAHDPLWRGRRDVSRFLWRPYLAAFGSSLAALPRLAGRHRRGARVDWAGVVESLRGRFPAGFFTNEGLAELLHRLAGLPPGAEPGFEDLRVPFLVTATDVDGGERVVFGPGHEAAPSVGMAVRASTAIPVYYEPVTLGGRDLIDGQIADPMHLDLAAPPGTRVVLGVNPLIPYRTDDGRDRPRVREIGAAAVMDQSGRISARIKHRRSLEAFRRLHPDVELLLVEPRPEEMLALLRAGHSPRALAAVWHQGFHTAARTLREEAPRLAPLLSPLGVNWDPAALEQAEVRWGETAREDGGSA